MAYSIAETQLLYLLDFMESHEKFAKSQIDQLGYLGNDVNEQLWERLRTDLNLMGPEKKSVIQWKQFWINTRLKAKNIMANFNSIKRTGGNSSDSTLTIPDNFTLRISKIFGCPGTGLSLYGEVGIEINPEEGEAKLLKDIFDSEAKLKENKVTSCGAMRGVLTKGQKQLLLELAKQYGDILFGTPEETEEFFWWLRHKDDINGKGVTQSRGAADLKVLWNKWVDRVMTNHKIDQLSGRNLKSDDQDEELTLLKLTYDRSLPISQPNSREKYVITNPAVMSYLNVNQSKPAEFPSTNTRCTGLEISRTAARSLHREEKKFSPLNGNWSKPVEVAVSSTQFENPKPAARSLLQKKQEHLPLKVPSSPPLSKN